MTRILYIITKGDTGGAQKYVNDLSRNLDKERFEAKILYGGRDLRWLSNRTYPWLLFANDWLAVLELVKIFQRERPHVIHLNSSKAGVLGSLAAGIYKIFLNLQPTTYNLQPKVVFTAHGWVFNPTNYYSPPVRWFYVLLHKFAALFQDKIINVSEHDHRLALLYCIAPAHKLVTIHNGIDPNISFLSKEEARKEILKRLPPTLYSLLSTTFPWIGSIGRLTKEKNYETLIEAARLVPEAYFFIIGDGPEFKKLQATSYKLQANDRVFIVPPDGNDVQLLKAFDIFALSSIKEGLPYTLLEAMAAELPVAATAVGGMPEIITHEKNGLLVPPRDAEALGEAALRCISNATLRETLGKGGALTVHAQFSRDQMLRETGKAYLA